MTTEICEGARSRSQNESEHARTPEIEFFEGEGRHLRVFRWKSAKIIQRRPLLFFSGIASNA